MASATQSVDPARVGITVTLAMDHVAEAARLQRHVNIHKRLAEIAEQHKKLDEEKTRLLEQLRPGASAQILVVCIGYEALTCVD